MTWQQYAMLGYLAIAMLGQLYALYNEPSGKEAFSRVIAITMSPIGWGAVLYSAGFWNVAQ